MNYVHLHEHIIHQLKDERSMLHDLAWELDEIEQQLRRVQATQSAQQRLDDSMLQQIERLYQRRSRAEDAVLYQMLYIERLEQQNAIINDQR